MAEMGDSFYGLVLFGHTSIITNDTEVRQTLGSLERSRSAEIFGPTLRNPKCYLSVCLANLLRSASKCDREI